MSLVKNHSFIPNECFPELMLNTEWDRNVANTLVHDYISRQAPVLLTLREISDKPEKPLKPV